MMKFNLAIFKGKNSIWWIVGAIILFIVFYMVASAGAPAKAGGLTVQNAGPSDAAIAANAQLTGMQLSAQAQVYQSQIELAALNAAANRDISIAQIQADTQLADTQASADIAKYVAANQTSIAQQQLTTQLAIARADMEYGLASSEVAAQTQLGLKAIDASTVQYQLKTNSDIIMRQFESNERSLAIQSQSLKDQAIISAVSTAPKGVGLQRIQAVLGQPVTPQKKGGFNIGSLISPVSTLF
jgi:hypothetical protein